MRTKVSVLCLLIFGFIIINNEVIAQYSNDPKQSKQTPNNNQQSSIDNDSKFHFGLNIGYCLPSGDFSSSDISKEPIKKSPSTDSTNISGYAKGGFHFNIYGAYMFNSSIGAMLSIGGSMNSYDIGSFNSNFSIGYPSNATPPVYTVSGNYFIGQFLVGPYFNFSASDNLKIEFKALIGLTTANYPALSFTYNYNSAYETISETGSFTVNSTSGFGYNIGAGLEYMVTGNLGLHFNLCYGGSSISYPSYTRSYSEIITILNSNTTTTPSNSTIHNTPMSMSIGLLQLTLGCSFDL
jgi:hypothetical protein